MGPQLKLPASAHTGTWHTCITIYPAIHQWLCVLLGIKSTPFCLYLLQYIDATKMNTKHHKFTKCRINLYKEQSRFFLNTHSTFFASCSNSWKVTPYFNYQQYFTWLFKLLSWKNSPSWCHDSSSHADDACLWCFAMHTCVSTNLFTAFDYIKLWFLKWLPHVNSTVVSRKLVLWIWI